MIYVIRFNMIYLFQSVGFGWPLDFIQEVRRQELRVMSLQIRGGHPGRQRSNIVFAGFPSNIECNYIVLVFSDIEYRVGLIICSVATLLLVFFAIIFLGSILFGSFFVDVLFYWLVLFMELKIRK